MHESYILASSFHADVLLGVYRDRVRPLVAWARAYVLTIGKSALGHDAGEYFYVHPYLPFAKRSLLRALQRHCGKAAPSISGGY